MAYVVRAESMEMIEGTASKFKEDVQILTYTTKFEKQPVSERFFLEHSETSVKCVLRRFLCPYGHLYHFGGETLPERK